MCADTLSPDERSQRMSLVRARDTNPEKTVRRIVTQLGYRYRLHYPALPGKPDLAFPGRRKAIWVHGCFWHRHEACALARLPKSRLDFWKPKLEGNKQRDQRNIQLVEDMGWKTLVLWECQTKSCAHLGERIRAFLES